MDASYLSRPPMPGPDGAADLPVWPAVSPGEAILASALWHGRWCGPVFPVVRDGKRPAVPHGFKSGSRDLAVIASWFEGQYAGCNIGLGTGYPGPNVFDVDVRPHGSGWPAFNVLKRAGLLAGAFRLVRTWSGGAHLYFAGTDQGCGSIKAAHLDLKARGGYVVVPPSHVSGRPYQIIDTRPPTGALLDWEACKRLLCPPRPAPVRVNGRRGPGSAKHLVKWLEGEMQGNRNNGLFWAACTALEAGDEAVIAELADVALSAGLGEAEVSRTISSAYKKVGNGW